VRAKRASKGDGPGRSSFEGRALRGHLRTTVNMRHQQRRLVLRLQPPSTWRCPCICGARTNVLF